MVYTVTLMNPLASGSDGTWHLDLLMEAVVGEPTAEPDSPANGSPGPPCNAGNGAVPTTAGGGSGGETSAETANNPLPPVGDVSDDDSECCDDEAGDDERQKREADGAGAGSGGAGARGGALPLDDRVEGAGGAGSGGDGAGGGGVLPEDGRAGVEGGERDGVEEVLEISDDSLDDSADDGGTDNEGDDEDQDSNTRRQGDGVDPAAFEPAALEMETGAAGFDDEQISSDELSSEDEPIGRAGEGSQPQKSALPTPPAEKSDRVFGTSAEKASPATPPRPSPPSPASAPSSARSVDKFRSPDSFASQTPESLNDDDSSFDESERDSGDSSDADMDYDSDGYEVDVPFPPCSVMHKERKTYKQSLCKECFETYTRDLRRAGVHRSDVDSDSGRTINRNRTRSRLRRQPRERAASSIGKQGMVDRRTRRLRRERRDSNSSNSDRKERRNNKSAVAASTRLGENSQREKNPTKKMAGGKKGKGNFPRIKRRLSKEGGVQTQNQSSSEAAELDDSSDSGSCDSGKGKGNDGAQRDKPRGRDRPEEASKPCAANPSAVGKTVIDIAHTDSSENGSAPAAAPAPDPAPPRPGSKKRSRQDTARAAATNSRGRGSDDFLGALMGGLPMQRAASVDSSFPPHQGSHPKLKRRLSVDGLHGRANTAEGSSFAGRDRLQLKQAESLDTATSRRDGLSSNGCNPSRPEAASGQDARPLRSIPELSSSASEHLSTASGTVGAPTKKSEKRRAMLSDARRPKPAKKARPAEKDPPAPISKKPAYTKVPNFKGVVRKVSNGKYFLWVLDKLHDGKPYDSADVCAKEYDKLTKPARGSQKGPRRNFGDTKAPSHVEMPGLTQLSLGADGGSRIAKKSLTSAYKQGQPAPAPARKASKNLFFAPRAEPQRAPQQQPQPPPAVEPLQAPPIVPSYNVSQIDLPMRLRKPKKDTDSQKDEGKNEDKSTLAYPVVHKISWAVTTETFRPVDGLHVPGDMRLLPRRSGLVGGRRGRPAPDTRWSCAQTGISRELSVEEPVEAPENSLPSNGATKAGFGLTSAVDKNTMHSSAATDKVASSSPTPSIPGAMPMPHTEPVTPTVPTQPQQPVVPTAAQVNTPVSSLLTEASLSAQGPANGGDRDRAKLSVEAAPPPNVSNGGGVLPASGVGEEGGAAVAVGEKHGPKEATGTGAGARVGGAAGEGDGQEVEHEAGGTRLDNGGVASTSAAPVAPSVEHEADGTRVDNGGGASTSASPMAPSVPLCGHLAQVRRTAGGSPRDAGSSPSQQQPTEEAEENRDEEDGRELLQSMMMNGGPADDADDVPADNEMELCSEEGGDVIVMERSYSADAEQLSYSEEAADHSDAAQSACCTQERDAEEDENVDAKSEPPGFEKFLADFRSSRQMPPVDPPAAAPLTVGTTVGDDPVPPSLSSTAAAGEEVNGGVKDAAPTMPALPPPPVAQVAWSTPLKISRRVNTNKAPMGDTVTPRTAWVQPPRLGSSSSVGVSTATPCATTPLPPDEELEPRAENVAAQSLPGSNEMPAPSDPARLPNETVAKVAWQPPSRLAPIVAKAIRPAVRFDRQPERQGGGIPPGVLQLPPDVAELLSESTATTGAGDDAGLEMPRAPLGAPDLLASPPSSRTQDLVSPSTSGSSLLPCDGKEELAGAEQAPPPSGSPKQPPNKSNETFNGQDAEQLKAKILARANAGEEAAAETSKPADESVLGARLEANGHSHTNGEAQAHDERRLVVKEKPAASSRGSKPPSEANPRVFSSYRASSSPSRHRSRSDSSRHSNRGSSSSSGVRERRRHGDDDRPRSRDSPRHSTADSSSGSSSRQRKYDGRGDHDYPHSRDDGHHRRRYEDFGRSGSRGSSDSSGRGRREESRYYPRDEFGKGWRDRDYDNNRFGRGGYDDSLRSPRDDRWSEDSKRLRRKRSLSPQRNWRR